MDASGFGRKKSGGLSDTGAGIPVLARLAWLCQLRSLHMQDARVFQTMVAIHHPFRSFVWKEMVVVTVSSEPVSASDFPIYREFTGKIGGFGLGYANSRDFCSD